MLRQRKPVFLALTIGVSSSIASMSSTTRSSTALSGSTPKFISSSAADPVSVSSQTTTSTPGFISSFAADPVSVSSPTSTSPPGFYSDVGRKIGLGTGIGVGIFAISAIYFTLVLIRRRLRHQSQRQDEHDRMGIPELGGTPSTPLAELDNDTRYAEATKASRDHAKIYGLKKTELGGTGTTDG